MIFNYLRLNLDIADDDFNEIYPERIRKLSKKHWTPIAIARQSAEFLAEDPGTKVLDIGSGAGKFCMIGSVCTKGHFTGVEQRVDLVELSNKIVVQYELENVRFIHSNITSLEFSNYDTFYFYNSFYENIAFHNRIDDSVSMNMNRYHEYSMHLFEQFCCLPIGTRVVTYHSNSKIIPSSYQLQFSAHHGLLNFWEKTK